LNLVSQHPFGLAKLCTNGKGPFQQNIRSHKDLHNNVGTCVKLNRLNYTNMKNITLHLINRIRIKCTPNVQNETELRQSQFTERFNASDLSSIFIQFFKNEMKIKEEKMFPM
jgi:hypothetical protein